MSCAWSGSLGGFACAAVLVLVACAGCTDRHATSGSANGDAASDAAGDASSDDAGAEDAGHGELTKVGATTQTSVIDRPSWPESNQGGKRIGYLRHGAIVAAYDRPVVNDDCKDGWFELEVGGYVCGKALTADLRSPKIRLAPKQPDLDAGMPYRYGVNLTDGTPLYRRVLPTEQRKKYEPWLVPKPEPEEGASDAEKADRSETTSEADESGGTSGARRDAGADAPVDAGASASRPKLKQLKGHGVVVRTMARGFYLALDRSFKSNGARWWRTSFGFAVPFERILVQPGVTKHVGSWFEAIPVEDASDAGGVHDSGVLEASVLDASDAHADAGSASLAGTVGFVNIGYARKLDISSDGKKLTWGAALPKRSAVMLDGREIIASGQRYHHTTSGFWVRLMDLTKAEPEPPADLQPGEKWIDVDLTRQSLVAFEGTRPVFATLISSGRRNAQDKEKDFPTPTGSFRIRAKHVTTTMDGDVASDGPYSIEDVPWVMYFQGSYALHGAFWHDAFGRKRSHGCVNMAPEDARSLFAWTEPALPRGWHGVFSRDDTSGTRVIVHEDPAPKR